MMGIFGINNDSTIIQEKVEQATTEKNVEEDWNIIMQICDDAGKSSEQAKNYLKVILKRLSNPDPHIGVKAVTLLDACVKNSGKHFLIEVASREFEDEFKKLMHKAPPEVAKKLRESLKKWSLNEFANDPQLNLIPSLYAKLKQNYDFSTTEPVKKSAPLSKDPNVVESQEEEDQILKAIELSLKDSGSPRSTATSNIPQSTSLYPSMNMSLTNNSVSAAPKEPRRVRALYDFEAAEDNELTFTSGEIILVLDDSDPNWWKGSNHRGEGLFPANFVTTDLEVEPETFLLEKIRKNVQFKEAEEVNEVETEPENVEINEQKIDRLLYLLHEADPTNPEKDTEEMLKLEKEVNLMGPLIDSELERVDRKHAQLTQLSTDLVDALSLYHSLMREPSFNAVDKMIYSFPPNSTPMGFNGSLPPNVPMTMLPHHGPERPFMHQQGVPTGIMHQHPPNPMGVPFQPMPNQVPLQMPVHEHFNRPGAPANFGHPSLIQGSFPQQSPISQTNIANGVQQPGPNFVTSSTHLSQ